MHGTGGVRRGAAVDPEIGRESLTKTCVRRSLPRVNPSYLLSVPYDTLCTRTSGRACHLGAHPIGEDIPPQSIKFLMQPGVVIYSLSQPRSSGIAASRALQVAILLRYMVILNNVIR